MTFRERVKRIAWFFPQLPHWNRWSISHRYGTCCRRTWRAFEPSSGWRCASQNNCGRWERDPSRPVLRPSAAEGWPSDDWIRTGLSPTVGVSKPHFCAAFPILEHTPNTNNQIINWILKKLSISIGSVAVSDLVANDFRSDWFLFR